MKKFIKKFSESGLKDIAEVGGKNASLGEMFTHLASKGIQVPDGFSVTAIAFRYYLFYNKLDEPLAKLMEGLNRKDFLNLDETGTKARNLILDGQMPDDLRMAITDSYDYLFDIPEQNVAVRSSATAEDLPTASFSGQLNGGNVGTNSATYTTNTIAATDNVQCVVTNNDTCPVSGTSNKFTGIIVTAYTTPTIVITSSATGAVCLGTPITFTAAITNGGTNPTYQWTVNSVSVGSNSPTFTSSSFNNGDIVMCRLTNQGGACLTTLFATSNTITVNIIAAPSPLPTVAITASANNVIIGTSITFTATTTNATGGIISYQWLVNGKNEGKNAPTFTTSSLINGDVVTCQATVVFTCSITVLSQQIVAAILGIPPLIIPNTFTPNGDSVNDTWNIVNLIYYPNATVLIYNRYGALLYQSKGYSVQWDGTYNGQPVPVGTYQYLIDIGDGGKRSGSVAVIR